MSIPLDLPPTVRESFLDQLPPDLVQRFCQLSRRWQRICHEYWPGRATREGLTRRDEFIGVKDRYHHYLFLASQQGICHRGSEHYLPDSFCQAQALKRGDKDFYRYLVQRTSIDPYLIGRYYSLLHPNLDNLLEIFEEHEEHEALISGLAEAGPEAWNFLSKLLEKLPRREFGAYHPAILRGLAAGGHQLFEHLLLTTGTAPIVSGALRSGNLQLAETYLPGGVEDQALLEAARSHQPHVLQWYLTRVPRWQELLQTPDLLLLSLLRETLKEILQSPLTAEFMLEVLLGNLSDSPDLKLIIERTIAELAAETGHLKLFKRFFTPENLDFYLLAALENEKFKILDWLLDSGYVSPHQLTELIKTPDL